MGIVFDVISSSLLRMINHTRMGTGVWTGFTTKRLTLKSFSLLSPWSNILGGALKRNKNKNTHTPEKKQTLWAPQLKSQQKIAQNSTRNDVAPLFRLSQTSRYG